MLALQLRRATTSPIYLPPATRRSLRPPRTTSRPRQAPVPLSSKPRSRPRRTRAASPPHHSSLDMLFSPRVMLAAGVPEESLSLCRSVGHELVGCEEPIDRCPPTGRRLRTRHFVVHRQSPPHVPRAHSSVASVFCFFHLCAISRILSEGAFACSSGKT